MRREIIKGIEKKMQTYEHWYKSHKDTTLKFTGDQVLLVESKENLEYMAKMIKEEYEKWGFSMNNNKTKYLCIGGEETTLQLKEEKIKV